MEEDLNNLPHLTYHYNWRDCWVDNTNTKDSPEYLSTTCNHSPKEYLGLFEKFTYCERCDAKL